MAAPVDKHGKELPMKKDMSFMANEEWKGVTNP